VDLFEYQGKQYFARYDIPVSPGGPADTVEEAVKEANQAGYPVVVKAQVQVGGRGKAGGIKLADNADEVREHAGNILGMDIKGHVVRRVWVEAASDIDEEYYVSFTLDRSEKQHLMMLSREGGVEIEVVAEENPDAKATSVLGRSVCSSNCFASAARRDRATASGPVPSSCTNARCRWRRPTDKRPASPSIPSRSTTPSAIRRRPRPTRSARTSQSGESGLVSGRHRRHARNPAPSAAAAAGKNRTCSRLGIGTGQTGRQ